MKQSNFFQIKNVTEHEYTLVGCDGSVITLPIQEVDKTASVFTIQDAKDGDVLALNGEVFIYAHRKRMYSIAVAHCFVDCAGGFYLDGEFGYTEKGNLIHPANKEQRELLFTKMKEAGYEWDAEKKELKKIEQKPAWSEEDESIKNDILDHLREYYVNKKGYPYVADKDSQEMKERQWLTSLKTKIQKWL